CPAASGGRSTILGPGCGLRFEDPAHSRERRGAEFPSSGEGVRPCVLLEIVNISGPHRHPTPPGDRCLNENEPSIALTTPHLRTGLGLSPSLALRYASYHVAAAAG
ncbi:unnamed protein product, partial [Ectocarpus sp. 12 AP-2014]